MSTSSHVETACPTNSTARHGTTRGWIDGWMDAKEGMNERVPVVRCNDGWMLRNECVLRYAMLC